jgi:hypothetical protein
MTLLTISDYYRDGWSHDEVVCWLIIILSYLGWVSAQVTALAWCSTCFRRAISTPVGMVPGTASIWRTRRSAVCGRLR